jgi:CHASE3 domain sensor protein
LPSALLALGAGASYEFATEHRLRTDYQAVAAHRAALRQTYSELLEAETGQRGFLLTGRPEYLQPYLKSPGRAANPASALEAQYFVNNKLAKGGRFAAWEQAEPFPKR